MTTLTPEEWARAAEVENILADRHCQIPGCDQYVGIDQRVCFQCLKEDAERLGFKLVEVDQP